MDRRYKRINTGGTMSEEQEKVFKELKKWYKVDNYQKADRIFYIKSFQHGEVGYFLRTDEIIFAKNPHKNQPNGLQWLKDNLLSEVDPLETLVADTYKRMKAIEQFNSRLLSPLEKDFINRAEVLLPMLKNK